MSVCAAAIIEEALALCAKHERNLTTAAAINTATL